ERPARMDLLGAQRRGQLRTARQQLRSHSGERDETANAREHPIAIVEYANSNTDSLQDADAYRDIESDSHADTYTGDELPCRLQRHESGTGGVLPEWRAMQIATADSGCGWSWSSRRRRS